MMEACINSVDKAILRELGSRIAEIGSQPVQAERIANWKKLNAIGNVRPQVYITEIPWQELDINNELTLRCTGGLAKDKEREMRQTLYQWKHFPADMVVSPLVYCDKVFTDTRYGIEALYENLKTDEDNPVVSKGFKSQIRNEDDLEKIRPAVVAYDSEQTQENFEALTTVFSGILPVEKHGVTHFWFAPWDYIVEWVGVQETLLKLVDEPDFMHKTVRRVVDMDMDRLTQYERLGLLSPNAANFRIGSGGYGYLDGLPAGSADGDAVTSSQTWGNAAAQIFGSVSPSMHEEFALQYEIEWLARFGMNYYGCCEPLHRKIPILRQIPHLRKISMSPWSDPDEGAEVIGRDYVFSCKPNPAVLAGDSFSVEEAERQLRRVLESTKGRCTVEVILKDISTVRHDPGRLWAWQDMAMRVVSDY